VDNPAVISDANGEAGDLSSLSTTDSSALD
jgi:hypothetical protein